MTSFPEDMALFSDSKRHFKRVTRHLRKHALDEGAPDTFVSGFDAESTSTEKAKKATAVPRALVAAASPVLARYLREAEATRPGHDIHLILEGTSATTIGLLQQFFCGVTINSISKEQAGELMLLCKMLKISKETITVGERESMISTDNEEQEASQAENKPGETKKKKRAKTKLVGSQDPEETMPKSHTQEASPKVKRAKKKKPKPSNEVDSVKETISSDSLDTDETMSKSHTEEPSPRAKKKKNPSNEVDSGEETILTDSLDPDESFIEEAAPKVKSPKNKKPKTAVSDGIDPSKKAISEEAASEVYGGEHEEKEDEGNLSDFVTATQTVPLKSRLSKGHQRAHSDSSGNNHSSVKRASSCVAELPSPGPTAQTAEPKPKKLSKLQLSRRWSETAKGSGREPQGKQVTTEKPPDLAFVRTPSKSPNRNSLEAAMPLRFSALNSEKKGPPKVAFDKERETMPGKKAKKKGDKYNRPDGLARHMVLTHYKYEMATFLDPADNQTCSECGYKARDKYTMLAHVGLKHKRILEYCSKEELTGIKVGVGHEDKQEKRHRDENPKKASHLESVKGTDSELGNHDSDIEDDENEENCFHED